MLSFGAFGGVLPWWCVMVNRFQSVKCVLCKSLRVIICGTCFCVRVVGRPGIVGVGLVGVGIVADDGGINICCIVRFRPCVGAFGG